MAIRGFYTYNNMVWIPKISGTNGMGKWVGGDDYSKVTTGTCDQSI